MMGAVQHAPRADHELDPADIFIETLVPTIVETVHLPARAARTAAVPPGYRRGAIEAITEAVEINIGCSPGILTVEQDDYLEAKGVNRYKKNIEKER